MNALHIKWTKPITAKKKIFFEEDFELLAMILSAMKWREKNGDIKLAADAEAICYYKKLGLDIIWNDIEELRVDSDIDPDMFWAAGKLYALSLQKAPVAVVDMDFIVWDRLDFDSIKDCAVIHFEDVNNDIYPDKTYFKLKNSKVPDFNMTVPACNTAFTVFKNEKLLGYYTDSAISFMKNSVKCGDSLRYMLFAEQRMLSMCADRMGANISALSDLETLSQSNTHFTHIWGMKQKMREDIYLRNKFCIKCLERIRNEYYDIFKILENTGLTKYLNNQ